MALRLPAFLTFDRSAARSSCERRTRLLLHGLLGVHPRHMRAHYQDDGLFLGIEVDGLLFDAYDGALHLYGPMPGDPSKETVWGPIESAADLAWVLRQQQRVHRRLQLQMVR